MSAGSPLEDRDVFTMMREGSVVGRELVAVWRTGEAQQDETMTVIVNRLEQWTKDVSAMLDGWVARYTEAFCVEADPETIPAAHDDGDFVVGPPVDPHRVLTELTLDELTKGPLTDLPALLDGLPAVPESGDIPLPNGCRLYWQTDKSINTRVYCSDEIGGGVDVWNPALIAPSTLLAAIVCEEHLGNLEVIHAQRRNEGKMRKSAQTFSIFGQIEAAAAEVMIKSGEITRIEPDRIPVSVRFNERNEAALFAVIVPSDKLERFEKIIADLRA